MSIGGKGNYSMLDEETYIKNQSSLSSEEHNAVCTDVEKVHLANRELGIHVPAHASVCLVLQGKPPIEILKENKTISNYFAPLLPTRTSKVTNESSSEIGDWSCEEEVENGSESIHVSSKVQDCSLPKPKGYSVSKSDVNCHSHCKKCLDIALDSRSGFMYKEVACLSLDKENSDFKQCKEFSIFLNDGTRQEPQHDNLSSIKNTNKMQRTSDWIEGELAGCCDNPEEEFSKWHGTLLEVGYHTSCLESGGKDSSSFEKIASSSQEYPSISAAYSNSFMASDFTTKALSQGDSYECSRKEEKGGELHNSESDPSHSPCLQGNILNVVNATLPSCISRKGCSETESVGVELIDKPVILNVFRRTNPRRAASSNNQTIVKFVQLSAARKCKNKNSPPILSSEIRVSSKVKGKRTSFHRLAKQSVWGGDANLALIFKQAEELLKI